MVGLEWLKQCKDNFEAIAVLSFDFPVYTYVFSTINSSLEALRWLLVSMQGLSKQPTKTSSVTSQWILPLHSSLSEELCLFWDSLVALVLYERMCVFWNLWVFNGNFECQSEAIFDICSCSIHVRSLYWLRECSRSSSTFSTPISLKVSH